MEQARLTEENEARDFHTKVFDDIKNKPRSWETNVSINAKYNIGHIFSVLNQGQRFGRWHPMEPICEPKLGIFTRISRQAAFAREIDYDRNELMNNPIDLIGLIIIRYESKRDKIKQEVAEVCKHCSETW